MNVASSTLGVPGYTFADLHDPEQLSSLYERFCEEAAAADPDLWRDWDAYRQAPDAPRTPLALSNLLIGMAPHVSRFVRRHPFENVSGAFFIHIAKNSRLVFGRHFLERFCRGFIIE